MNGPWDSERDPLVALRDGDPTLFEAFVASQSGVLLAFFRRRGVTPNEAEDLVQEVFLKLFRHAANYQPSGRFQAFAFRIAQNAWIDRSRRLAVRPRLLGSNIPEGEDEQDLFLQEPSTVPSPLQVAEEREEAGRIEAHLSELSEGQRMVFELGVIQELAYSEIASILEIPEGTVKSRMFHAVRRLRSLVESKDSTSSEGAAGTRRAQEQG